MPAIGTIGALLRVVTEAQLFPDNDAAGGMARLRSLLEQAGLTDDYSFLIGVKRRASRRPLKPLTPCSPWPRRDGPAGPGSRLDALRPPASADRRIGVSACSIRRCTLVHCRDPFAGAHCSPGGFSSLRAACSFTPPLDRAACAGVHLAFPIPELASTPAARARH